MEVTNRQPNLQYIPVLFLATYFGFSEKPYQVIKNDYRKVTKYKPLKWYFSDVWDLNFTEIGVA